MHDDSKASCHLDGLVALKHVAGLDVIVAVDFHTAFHTGFDLAYIVLEALELFESSVLLYNDSLASNTNLRVSLDESIRDIATGDRTNLAVSHPSPLL